MFSKLFSRTSMGFKQWGSYLIIIAFFAVLNFVAYLSISDLQDQVDYLGKTQTAKVEYVGHIKEDITRVRLYVTKHAYEQDLANKEKMKSYVDEDIADVRNAIKAMKELDLTDENIKLLDEFSNSFETYVANLPDYYEGSLSNDYNIVHELMGEMAPLGEDAVVALAKLSDDVDKNTDSLVKDSEDFATKAVLENIAVSIGAGIFSIFISFVMTRLIRRSVKAVVKNVEVTTSSVAEIKKSIDQSAIAAQELDASMDKTSDSLNELVSSIQEVAGNTTTTTSGVNEISAAIEEMSSTISLVATSADHLSDAADKSSDAIQEMMASIEQVAGNAGNVGAGVEQISAAIEEMSKSIDGVSFSAVSLLQTADETSKSVQEMVTSVQQVASSTHKMNELSQSVKTDAVEGASTVNETLNAMKEISKEINQASNVMINLGKSSEEIGSIIETIDDIAGQTNLLALNAAIEAARAGEHGKGFAVVADEVRKLAERSAQATKEIANLIKGIQNETVIAVNSIKSGADKVEVGNQLADKTNDAIKKITQGITIMSEEMNQIVEVTETQSKNTALITKSVENVSHKASEMTQSTKEQALTAQEVVKGIMDIKSQVQQITSATAEQARGGSEIVASVENVTSQSNSVTAATREQALAAEEIVRNLNAIKNMVKEITVVTNDQARFGQEISSEIAKVRKQTNELNESIETQTKEAEGVAEAIHDVEQQVDKLK
ncbi:methyl-accepting chemotaxis protein [Bacillus sp. DNRA2]|uniref:methyl-accepting chemotaxis protein n=1 Tax=Bacillus sp. DNRA2 TaxID=2723053 RepID=UPI001B7CE7A6|nr:methyl-accepting chemotaxis protein [Bacillus sp. DNRA2]